MSSGWSPGGFDDADASSATTILAAPGAGKKIVARAAYLSSNTACKVSFSAGSSEDAKHHQHVAANSGSVIAPPHSGDLLIDGDENTALTVTSSVAAQVTGKIWHTVVSA